MNPFVVGIMPTRGRVDLAHQAVECFFAQTYEYKSLVIIDDDDDRSFPNGIDDKRIQYSCMKIRYNIPQKLNMACEIAAGADIIYRQDSDDWSYPGRMEDQVWRIEESGKAVTGYHSMPFLDVPSGKVYEYQSGPYYALGSSLTFLRSWWVAHRFNEKKFTGSDTAFVTEAAIADQIFSVHPEGAMVARILGKGSSTYGNDSSLNTAPKNFMSPEYVPMSALSLPLAFRDYIGVIA